MGNLSLDEMLELAKRVYPGFEWFLENGRVLRYNEAGTGDQYFNPSLTGEDWQQVQALRVIVAAWEKASKYQNVLYKDVMVRGFVFKRGEDGDLFTAASLALLSGDMK